MTRLDAARDAAGKTRDTLAPYAATAKDTAAQYADGARRRLAPKVEAAAAQARCTARSTYDQHLAPRVEQARGSVPPQVEVAAARAAQRTRETALTALDAAVAAAQQARATATPAFSSFMEDARTAAAPVAQEAQARSAAVLAVLRGQVTAAEVEKLANRHARRQRCGRVTKRLLLVGLAAGGGFAAWKWWRRQSSPEWLVEPPAEHTARPSDRVHSVSATGLTAADAATLGNTVDGSMPSDPEFRGGQDADGEERP
ncbi:DUF5324 family protein [Streptomyces sp. NPDC092296]|uniref:DUF5324 family protein n=1 Tax=Streptomyces sp. NPDC092296 TaxID=3366012 RepID=UPI0037F9BB8A